MVEYYYVSERKEHVTGYHWSRGYRHGMGNVLSGNGTMNTRENKLIDIGMGVIV